MWKLGYRTGLELNVIGRVAARARKFICLCLLEHTFHRLVRLVRKDQASLAARERGGDLRQAVLELRFWGAAERRREQLRAPEEEP